MKHKKIAWLTDTHFDQCDINEMQTLIKDIKKNECDSVLITGDISEKGTTGIYLQFLQKGLGLPLFFVCGNHDWYDIQRDKGQDLLNVYLNENLVLLDNVNEIKLSKSTCLIGGENWWDAAFSETFGLLDGYVMGEDYQKIDFISPKFQTEKPFEAVRNLSRECSDKIISKLLECFKKYDKVHLAVHVPPFAKACIVGGIQMPNNWLNHFCDQGLGIQLENIMRRLPEKKLKVLCGHTHGKIKLKISDNLSVNVGAARVGKPKIAEIIEV